MKIFISIFILLILFSCSEKEQKSSISVQQLRSLLHDNPNTALIDVRTAREFNGSLYHIKGAQSMPLSVLSTYIADLKNEDGKKYYMICKTGARSAKATQIMKDSGLNAINVSGGMMAWHNLKNSK